jgi:hypothetical protein
MCCALGSRAGIARIDGLADSLEPRLVASNTDTEQLAFELEAVLDLPSWSVGDDSLGLELQRARRGVDKLLGSARTPAAKRPPLAKRSRQRVGA